MLNGATKSAFQKRPRLAVVSIRIDEIENGVVGQNAQAVFIAVMLRNHDKTLSHTPRANSARI